MSAIDMRPLKRAETGPTRAAITTRQACSPSGSSDSQPGRQSLSTAGSFSAAQTTGRGRGTVRVFDSSMKGSVQGLSGGRSKRTVAGLAGCRLGERMREIGQCFEIVHRQEIVDMRQKRANPGGTRFEARVAQQRI